ncbi:hypothetical protein J437_LFUL005974 [Ladona fulva]|uniref:Hyaluronidase n=1 Tax=Ladona fulva TaxID=123851 RepID=A0A8K0NY26_LADFU|nr:hypothetical protein J437_LFUL005974 [Ladona fulva]
MKRPFGWGPIITLMGIISAFLISESSAKGIFNVFSIFKPIFTPLERRTPDIYSMEVPDKNFNVYWNVPTFMCRKYGVLFNLSEYGIFQNEGDDFRGSTSLIMYDPGVFPALVNDEGNDPGPSKRSIEERNGGVPQRGDLSLHLKTFREELEQMIPDPNFSGVAVIDFEFWRPAWRQNWGSLLNYRELSRQIEKKKHPFWSKEQIEAEARRKFEFSARKFMEETLKLARRLRPKGRWGYYAFPYCHNFTPKNPAPTCAPETMSDNDQLSWLYDASSAIFPSIYLEYNKLTEEEHYEFIYGRIGEAKRVTRGTSTPVYPYIWYRYRDTPGYLSKVDLFNSLVVPRLLNADGAMIWGSGKDVDSAEKCQRLLNYAHNTLGPIVKFVSNLPQGKITSVDIENQGRKESSMGVLSDLETPSVQESPNNFPSINRWRY